MLIKRGRIGLFLNLNSRSLFKDYTRSRPLSRITLLSEEQELLNDSEEQTESIYFQLVSPANRLESWTMTILNWLVALTSSG